MIYTYNYNIADLHIQVNSPIELTEQFELTPFVTSGAPEQRPDALYTISMLPADWKIKGTKLSQNPHSAVYQWQHENHRYFFWNVFSEERFILLISSTANPREYTIYLQENTLHRMMPQFRLSAFLAPEQLLIFHRAFLLHSSVIDWNGKGILFTGPSGIGKSTQAMLWEKFENAQTINGDRAIIRCSKEITVWGSPYAGTSRIYKNQGVPVHAIVILAQGSENILRPLSGLAAFQYLLQEATTEPWNGDFMGQLTDLILDITSKIPIYHLTCSPDAQSVQILKDALLR